MSYNDFVILYERVKVSNNIQDTPPVTIVGTHLPCPFIKGFRFSKYSQKVGGSELSNKNWGGGYSKKSGVSLTLTNTNTVLLIYTISISILYVSH